MEEAILQVGALIGCVLAPATPMMVVVRVIGLPALGLGDAVKVMIGVGASNLTVKAGVEAAAL